MTKEIWINLPVKDVAKAVSFYTLMGFTQNTHGPDNAEMACMLVGEKKIALMLVHETRFRRFIQVDISDNSKGIAVLLNIDAESRDEVHELARKAEAAGGKIMAAPMEVEGWMYGFNFADLDGHTWNVLHMDFSKLPQK